MIGISVIVFTFNHEKYLRQAMDSFVCQKTDFEFEILVHDDASTDRTQDIIREYQKQYPDLIKPILQTENQYSKGVDTVREYVFPRCQGEYIAFCEGDDYWCDDRKLQKQYTFLKNHPEYSACVHNSAFIDAFTGKSVLKNPCKTEKDITFQDVILARSVEYHMSALVYKRDYMYRPDAFKAKAIGDLPRALYLSYVGKMHYFPDVMSVHRVNIAGSWTSRNVGSIDAEKQILHYRKIINMLKNIDEYTEGSCHEIIEKAVRWDECIILQWEDNAKKILTDYQDIYNGMTKNEQRIIRFKAYFPKTFKFLNKIRMNMKKRKI